MFRLALDSLGGMYERARVALCLGAPAMVPVPARWRPYLRRVEVLWAPTECFMQDGHAGSFRYDVLDATCDLSILCDADTLPIRPFPPADLEQFIERPAIRGVIAHVPPPLVDDAGHNYSACGPDGFWQVIARRILGAEIPLTHSHTLKADAPPCPFYVNYGVVIGSFAMLHRLRVALRDIRPQAYEVLSNRFVDQVALTLGCVAAGLPTETLPMRYNFPNDPVAEARYPDECADLLIIHYLRLRDFDRHTIFVSAEAFSEFLSLRLDGSNRVFQERVMAITGGAFPFH